MGIFQASLGRPVPLSRPEVARQPQGCIGADGTGAMHNPVDAPGMDADVVGQPIAEIRRMGVGRIRAEVDDAPRLCAALQIPAEILLYEERMDARIDGEVGVDVVYVA